MTYDHEMISVTFDAIFFASSVEVWHTKENPAYRRHQISRPMRIVAPILFSAGVVKGIHFSSGDCRLWTSSHKGDRVVMAVRTYFFIRRLQVWTFSEFSSGRPSGDCRIWCRLWTSSEFSSMRSSGNCRLWTSSEFSSIRQSSDRPMKGQDLIM